MIKNKNKKFKTSFLYSSLLLVPATSAGLGTTLFTIHSKENMNQSTAYGNFLESESLFKIYSPYINIDQRQKELIQNSYNQAKEHWKAKDKGLVEKLASLDKVQKLVFDFYINHLNEIQFQDQDPLVFWNKIISNQEDRIRELDLKQQLLNQKQNYRVRFFNLINTTKNKEKQHCLKELSNQIDQLVSSQNKIFDPFINLLETTANKLDHLPFNALKKDVNLTLTPLYSRIISSNIHLNEVEIASQNTNAQVAKLDQMLSSSQNEIDQINQYLNLIKPFANNVAYSQKEKDNVKSFLDSTKMEIDMASNKADINQIYNNVLTFYQQISDTQKSVEEIKQVILNLSTYVEKFHSLLNYNKQKINSLIIKIGLINNKKELISAKSDLFTEFYNLQFANKLIDELNQKINQALENHIINKERSNWFNAQIIGIVNKRENAKKLSQQLFSFYTSLSKELEDLTLINKELKLIQTQISKVNGLKFTSDNIKSKLNELNNEVVKTYSNILNVSYLSAIKKQLNEELRSVLRTNLKQMMSLFESQIKLVKNLNDPNNKNLLAQAKSFNDNSLEIKSDFNPISSIELIDKIIVYNSKIQNLVNVNKQAQAQRFASFNDDDLKEVFSNNDANYIPTKNEQKRIDLYKKYKKQLDEIRTQISKGQGDFALESRLENISQKLYDITHTSIYFRKLSQFEQQASKIISQKQNQAISTLIKPYIDNAIAAHSQAEALFDNPNATLEQVLSIYQDLEKALNNLDQIDTKILVQAKIEELKTAIDINYQDNYSSLSARALLNQYNQLIEQIQESLNQDEIQKIAIKANHLISLIPDLYQLELNLKELSNVISFKISAPYTGTRTTEIISLVQEELKNASEMINLINLFPNILSLQELQKSQIKLSNFKNEILQIYNQEKINKINQEIQNTASSQSGEANDIYRANLTNFDNYVNESTSTELADKMEILKELANISSELLSLYNLYNVDQTKTLSLHISSLLENNHLSAQDTREQILRKINTLKQAHQIVKAKKSFLDVAEKLNNILKENQDWKIYQELKNDADLISEKIKSIINDDSFTVEQIQAQKDEFETKIKIYKNQKNNLFTSLNQAIIQVDNKQTILDNNIVKLSSSNETYYFNNYYQQVKDQYQIDKNTSHWSNVDSNDIMSYLIKLEIGYLKDFALNNLRDIQSIANSIQSSDLDLKNKIQNSQTSFVNWVKSKIQLVDSSLLDIESISQKITQFLKLLSLQKRVLNYINKSKGSSTQNLKNTINASIVDLNNLNNINSYYSELNKTYLDNAQSDEIKTNILELLENDDLSKGEYGIVKSFNNQIGSTFDPVFITKLNSYIDDIKKSINSETLSDNLKRLLTKVNWIKEKTHLIAELAINVGISLNALSGIKSNNPYYSKLNDFIEQARENYFNVSSEKSTDYYSNLNNQIRFTTQKLIAFDALALKIKEIKDIINKSSFNLRSLNGQSGLEKRKEFNDYLTNFEKLAVNDQYNQLAIARINDLFSKANEFKNLVQADEDTLLFATSLVINNFATSKQDLNDALKLVWDSVPEIKTKSVREYQTLVQKNINNIYNQTALIKNRNIYRNENDIKITSLKESWFAPLVHNELKTALTMFLDKLKEQNSIQNTLTIAPDQSGELNIIRKQLNLAHEKLEALKILASKVYQLNDLTDKIKSNESLVNDAKNKALELIKKAKEYYGNTDKMSLKGENSIESITEQVENEHLRLSLLHTYDKVKNQCETNDILSDNEKNVIRAKLNEFINLYNDPNSDLNQLFNTYFGKIEQFETSKVKNSLIQYVLDNAIKLKKEFNRALSYISFQDSSLDNAAVATKFNQINSLINGESGVVATLVNTNNNEETKIHLFNVIKSNIDQLISAKRDQLKEQLNYNNELKSYFNTTINKLESNNKIIYVDGFEQKGIEDLKTAINKSKDLSYSQVNEYLLPAKAVAKSQVFNLYIKVRSQLENIQSDLTNYVNDFDPSKSVFWRGASSELSLYNPLLILKEKINYALSSYFGDVKNYSRKVDSLMNLIQQGYQKNIDKFVKLVKEKFTEKFAPSGSSNGTGFYVALISKLDQLKQNTQGTNSNIYKQNQAQELENQYDSFKREYEKVNNVYASLENKKDSTSLANFANLLDKLNYSFLDLQKSVLNTLWQKMSINPLENIFSDLYQDIEYENNSVYTDDIKNKFNELKASIQAKYVQINTSNFFDFASLDQNSDLPQKLFELIQQIKEYNDWIKKSENNSLLFKQLEVNPNKENPLKPIQESLDKEFDQKYKAIIANEDITRKKFTQTFEGFVSNKTQDELVEIDNNDKFLQMFKQFAFTNKDVEKTGDLKSIFSPLKLKVYIKKYNENGWFDLITPTQEEVDRQSLKAKIVYKYETNNFDLGEVKVEKEVVITFKTIDTISIPRETSSIFIKDGKDVGIKAKYEVIDVDEAGWNIPQVSDEKDSNAQNVKNQVITKVYNKMKTALFGLNGDNSQSLKNNTDIIKLKEEYQNSFKSTNKNIRYTGSPGNSRLSVYLDKDNRNSITKYGFDFENQLSIPLTYNVSLTSNKDYEILNIIPLDNEKGFSFLQLNGGFITGFPTYGKRTTVGKPERYEYLLRGRDGTDTFDIYNNYAWWWTTTPDKLPTGLNLNLYIFNIDYDPVKRKVYFYNSWTQNIVLLINKKRFVEALNKYKDDNSLKQSEKDLLKSLSTKIGNDPKKYGQYRISPEDLAKTFSIFASFSDQIFKNTPPWNGNWLVSYIAESLGGNPIFPITGGESTVYRTDKDKPETATLRNIPAADYQQKSGELIKASARQALYAAWINKFWFKIR
ncbi:hypothetical protein NPA11_01485 [Mycoplasma sp. 1578d]|uniref:hypothetical protein n=1 Tax=Mycoplasma sp. 1578d TaxID=2967299 RepID=UPI00211CA0FA|nr:hypothetical protein [Mycoplasma sp. 1578d]UUM20081.1 hypothetical protein NPA11_01485 [Mycoplasma sp. 1578d]